MHPSLDLRRSSVPAPAAPRALALALLVACASGCSERRISIEKQGEGSGVVVVSDQAALECGARCEGPFSGTPLTLRATPDDESDFTSWTCAFFTSADENADPAATKSGLEETLVLAGAPLATPEGPLPFDRVSRIRCTAAFAREPVLTVVPSGPGTVRSTTAGVDIDCGDACTASVDRGAKVTLVADPGPSTFVGWREGCSGVEPTITVTVDRALTCGAEFIDPATLARLTIEVTGAGSFTSTPAGISECAARGGDCEHVFSRGTRVTLTPTLPPGSTVESWGACGPDGEIELHNDTTCTIVVRPPPAAVSWNVFVEKSGDGTGSVASEPAGLTCDAACAIGDAALTGDNIALTASPEAGSAFGGFTCACTISGVPPGTLACTTAGGTGGDDTTVSLGLSGLEAAAGADVVVRLECGAAFAIGP